MPRDARGPLAALEASARRIAELEAALERARGVQERLIAAAVEDPDATIPQIAHAAGVSRERVRRLARRRGLAASRRWPPFAA